MSDLVERLEFTGRARVLIPEMAEPQLWLWKRDTERWDCPERGLGGVDLLHYVKLTGGTSVVPGGVSAVPLCSSDREPPVGSVVRVVTPEVAVQFAREGRGWAPDEDAVTVERWAELFHGANYVELLSLPSTADSSEGGCPAAEDTAQALDAAIEQRPATPGQPGDGPYPATVAEVADEVVAWIRTTERHAAGLGEMVLSRLSEKDELDDYLVEAWKDPEFAAAYDNARRRDVDGDGMDDAVLRFHRLMGCAIAEPRERWAEDRLGLLREEMSELEGSLNIEDDAVYVAVGTATALGYRLGPVYDEVCAANLRKLGEDGKPILRPSDGKVMKPEGWTPPDVASVMVPVSREDGAR